ncbi:uncharacterized protein marchf1 isoform X3 [Siphateles boraxobius]|uniref:uncharacterized protein marchf1 isoform X3 n=1 Tax=Siphateles boraxobius TaxID=180520 RepID=UPI00406327E1
MPVHQISVVPITKENGNSSSRNRDKSKENEASNSTQGAALNSVSQTSVAASSQDICSSSGCAKLDVNGSDQTTPVMPINPTSDPAPTTKRQVKRRIRRRRERTRSVGCAKECVGQTRHSRSHKQVHTHSDSSSEDEQCCREARSWSREKARRRRSGSRHTQTHPREERDGIELMSVNSDEGQKENQPPLCKDPDTNAHKKLLSKREERGGQSQAANHKKGSEHATSRSGSEEEEEPITKTYEERDSGDPDMSVPSPCKCTIPTNQNGATQQASTDDEQEVCRICHCEGDEECPLITPCHCTGSLRFVHQTCLHQWIKSSDTRCCELCKYDFIMETHLKPLRKWEKLQMPKSERRKIFCSVAFHLAAVVCVIWSLYVLIDRTAEEIRQGKNNGVLEWPFWTKLIVVAVGFFGGLIFLYIQCKVYLQLWRKLKAFNRIIFVQNCPETVRNGENRPPPVTQSNGTHGAVEVPVPQTQTNTGDAEVAPV